MELQQKIQANIGQALASEFPSLKLPLQNQQTKVEFHIEHKADGTFDIHSSDPGSPSVQGASGDEVESVFAEKVLGFLSKHMAPEFSQVLGAQLASGNVKVFVTRNVSVKHSPLTITNIQDPPAQLSPVSSTDTNRNAPVFSNSSLGMSANDCSPITPGRDSSATIFRFVSVILIIFGLIYLYLHLHH